MDSHVSPDLTREKASQLDTMPGCVADGVWIPFPSGLVVVGGEFVVLVMVLLPFVNVDVDFAVVVVEAEDVVVDVLLAVALPSGVPWTQYARPTTIPPHLFVITGFFFGLVRSLLGFGNFIRYKSLKSVYTHHSPEFGK